MEAGFSQSTTPILLYLKSDNDMSLPFTDEFKRLAPHWEISLVHNRLAVMRYLTDAPMPQAFLVEITILDEAGAELIEWIKGQPQFRFQPIIVLSNSNDPVIRQRCVAMGVTSYLDKPKSLKEMRNNIRYIVKLCEGARFHSQERQEMACV